MDSRQSSHGMPNAARAPAPEFKLLDDQPYSETGDPLGFGQIALDLSGLVKGSRASTPLVIGVQSGWGMGKSTLMRQLNRVLAGDDNVKTVWFNAWTAPEGDALEGLVKSVLDKLDRRVIRKSLRSKKLLNWARLIFMIVADLLRLSSLANALWRQASIDPQVRNEVQGLVAQSMQDWAHTRAELGPDRLLVVFIDDLDRCPPVNVLQVFEAVKLYLDAPGLVFIVGYDPEVVTDAVLNLKQYSETEASHRYLEKIVQIAYRLPDMGDDAANDLLDDYLQKSSTAELFDDAIRSLTVEQNARNPRRMKRFINAFVLEYALDAEWAQIGATALVRVLIIDVYFPEFGRLLRARTIQNPVEQFQAYADVRKRLRRRTSCEDAEGWAPVEQLVQSYGIAVPPGDVDHDKLLEKIEQEVPASFPRLVTNPDFLVLLSNFSDVEKLREKLRRFSPVAANMRMRKAAVAISYEKDDTPYVAPLYRALAESLGQDRVWIDRFLPAGVNWADEGARAFRSADVVLSVIGPSWDAYGLRKGRPAQQQIATALSAGKPVIPVLVGGVPFPRMLPDELLELAYRQAVVLQTPDKVDRLVEAIEYVGADLPREAGRLDQPPAQYEQLGRRVP